MFTSEDYVSLETAKMLKEKGFDNECDYYISEDGNLFYKGILRVYNKIGKVTFLCPTLYEAQKWLIERHNLFVEVSPLLSKDKDDSTWFTTDVYIRDNSEWDTNLCLDKYVSYQQALDAGLQEALKLI